MVQASAEMGVSWLDSAGPLAVWVISLSFLFIECALIIGLFLPGDSLLLAAGVILAQHNQHLNAWLLSIAALIVAVVGNQVGYIIGERTGTKFVARRGGKVLNRANLERARSFLDRKGFLAIVASRYIPYVRTLAPTIAGAAQMNNRRFLIASLAGAVLWVPTLVLLGYYGAGLLDSMPWFKTLLVVLSIGFMVIGTTWGLWRYRQEMRKPVDDGPETAKT